jgi:predicted small secreted protein
MKSLIVLVAACLVLAGCNTMKGLGQDIEDLGNRIQKKAQ